jgi:hypothetical protein
MAKRRTITEATERAARRSSREMLVAQLRKLPVDDLHDVLFDFGGLASRAAPLAVEAINEGMTAAKAGQFSTRVKATEDASPAVPAPKQNSPEYGEDAED